jgi:hypothetical protein
VEFLGSWHVIVAVGWAVFLQAVWVWVWVWVWGLLIHVCGGGWVAGKMLIII